MKITLDSDKRRTILLWLKKGEANLNEIPEVINSFSIIDRYVFENDEEMIELDREGKLTLLEWLKNGEIDTSAVSKVFGEIPTFEELLIESGIIADESCKLGNGLNDYEKDDINTKTEQDL